MRKPERERFIKLLDGLASGRTVEEILREMNMTPGNLKRALHCKGMQSILQEKRDLRELQRSHILERHHAHVDADLAAQLARADDPAEQSRIAALLQKRAQRDRPTEQELMAAISDDEARAARRAAAEEFLNRK